MAYANARNQQNPALNVNQFGNIQQQLKAQIFVRNYAKNAIKLTVAKKIQARQLFDIISIRMKLVKQDIHLFLHGKQIDSSEQQIQLYNGLIFHIVNAKRVQLPHIQINCKRIQPNATVHNIIINSDLTIRDFLSNVLVTKYSNIDDYFLVYVGKELLLDNTFKQQWVEHESQILVIHKIQNLKSRQIQVKKNNKNISKTNLPRENKIIRGQQSSKVSKSVCFSLNKQLIDKQTKLTNNNTNYSAYKQNIAQSQQNIPKTAYQKHKQEKINKLNEDLKNKYDKRLQQQNSYEEQGCMTPCQLYETAKFNSPEQLLQFGKNSNKSKILPVSSQIQKEEQDEEEGQQILIGNYDAFTYSRKQNIDEKQIKQANKQRCAANNQIMTRYGLVPKQRGADINRYEQEKQNNTDDLNETGIIILGQKYNQAQGNGDRHIQVQEKEEFDKQLDKEEPQRKIQNELGESNAQQNSAADIRNSGRTRHSGSNNPQLLATISSRYDEQQVFGLQSLMKSGPNRSLNPSHVFYNGEGSIINIINSSNNSDIKSRKLSNQGSNQNPHIKNIYLTDSVQLEEVKDSQSKDRKSKHIISERKSEQQEQQMERQRIKINEENHNFNSSDDKQKKIDDNQQVYMKKRHNRVEVKDMIQTVSPNFYKPLQQADTPPKLEEKQVHRSEVRTKKKKMHEKNNSEGHKQENDNTDEQQIEQIMLEYDAIKEAEQLNKIESDNQKQNAKQKNNKHFKRTDSQNMIGGDDLLTVIGNDTKDKHSSDGVDSNVSAVQLYLPLVDLPMIKPIKLPTPIKFKIQQRNEETERRKREEAAALKDQILRNISHVSSVYHQPSESSNPASRHDAMLPQNFGQMRDSFTSNVMGSERGKLWEDQSNRFSIGSIQSQTLYMTELPQSSGQLGIQHVQNQPHIYMEGVTQQKYSNSYSSSNENLSNILGSEAEYKENVQTAQKIGNDGVDSGLRSSSTSNMRKKNKVEQIQNISSIIKSKSKSKSKQPHLQKVQAVKQQPVQSSQIQHNEISSPDVLVHFGVEKNNVYEEMLDNMNEVNRSIQNQPTHEHENQGDLCYSKHTDLVDDSASYNLNVMQDSKSSNIENNHNQPELFMKKHQSLDQLSQIKPDQVWQSGQKQLETEINQNQEFRQSHYQKENQQDSLLLQNSQHNPTNSEKSIEKNSYQGQSDVVLRSMQEIKQTSNFTRDIQSDIKNTIDKSQQNLLQNYLDIVDSSPTQKTQELQQIDSKRKIQELYHRMKVTNNKIQTSFNFSFSLGKETKIQDKDIGINIGDMIMTESTNALYNMEDQNSNSKGLTVINYAQLLRKNLYSQFQQIDSSLFKKQSAIGQPKNQQDELYRKSKPQQEENLLLQYL